MKVTKEQIYGGISAFVMMCALTYFIIPALPPYIEAKRFIEHSFMVSKDLGRVHTVTRSLWSPFYYKNNAVHAELDIVGERATAKAYMDLIRTQDGWRVKEAKVITEDNREVQVMDEINNGNKKTN